MPLLFKKISVALLVFTALITAGSFARASQLDDLQVQMTAQTLQLKQLDAEIKSLNGKITTTKKQASSLKGEIAKLEATRQTLIKSMSATQGKINLATAAINKLSGQITQTLGTLEERRQALAETFRNINQLDKNGLLEIALSSGSLSGLMEQTETLASMEKQLNKNILALHDTKSSLDSKKNLTEQEKKMLTSLKDQLADQKQIADQNKQEKNTLLVATNNQESQYQKMLADRLKKKQQVEAEISQLESQIDIIVNPKSLPSTAKAILSWPVDKIILTQFFGNTDFATKNPQVYNGKGHNGIDLGTAVGTAIHAAADGTVTDTGNTDLACAGASYGKWVLLKHSNGLSTLYAHLSLIKVSPGQAVSRGQTIALSGNTGYTTGPHLHFTVYASEAVSVQDLKSKVASCGTYHLPVSSFSGYLNPLSYLPPR